MNKRNVIIVGYKLRRNSVHMITRSPSKSNDLTLTQEKLLIFLQSSLALNTIKQIIGN